MKRLFLVILMLFLNFNLALAKDKYIGKGQVQFDDQEIKYFKNNYLNLSAGLSPAVYWIAVENGKTIWSMGWYCPNSSCANVRVSSSDDKFTCENEGKKFYKNVMNINKEIECFKFAKRYKIVWDNGNKPENWKQSLVKKGWSESEVKNKFKDLGFYGVSTSSSTTTSTPKITKKKEPKKVVKKYELKGERSIALSWDGYEDLIAGTVEFDEADYRGTLNLPLPNNDGTCDGTYSLQEGGKGTWQIACTNNMGAAGTLKWTETGGVTGSGRDHNDKKVKFTVSKKS